jgi:hypothetical protein
MLSELEAWDLYTQRLVAALVASFLFITLADCSANAQKGTAPSGYYPSGYSGDIFSGEFVPSDDASAIKLVYKNGSKTESFDGRIEAACEAPTQASPRIKKELPLSAISAGTVLTVYYTPTAVKVDGKKVHTNLIWGIRFDLVNGKRLTDPNRPIISCSHHQTAPFRAF